jgi:hypothetical protein
MIFFATARPARSSPNAAERSCAQNRALHALRSSEAHPQARSIAPPWPERAKDEFLLAATAQNLRKLAKLIPLPAPIFAT